MKYTTVFFDLDGTLTDSQRGITSTIRDVLVALGREGHRAEELTWCVGPPLRDSFVTLLGEDGALPDQAMELYAEMYERGGMFVNSVYPGVREGLEAMKATGRKLAVVTGKPDFQAVPILKHFGLLDFFCGVYGPTRDNRCEDKGRLIGVALRGMEAQPGECLYIGDRAGDVRGARQNGVDMLAVRYGYGSDEELREAGASFFTDSPEGWLASVERLERLHAEG